MRQLGAGRAGRRAGAGRALHSVRACAARERKDPRQFRDMDAARDYLHARDGAAFTIAGVLNWLSSRAFGQQTSQVGWAAGGWGCGSCPGQAPHMKPHPPSPLQQAPPWDLGRVYRWLTRPDQVRPPAAPQLSRQQLAAALAAAGVSEAAVEQLALLMLCSWPAAAKIALRHPHVLHMDSRQLVQRLLSLKSLLPECDVARLVEEAPRCEPARRQAAPHASAQQLGSGCNSRQGAARAPLPGSLVHHLRAGPDTPPPPPPFAPRPVPYARTLAACTSPPARRSRSSWGRPWPRCGGGCPACAWTTWCSRCRTCPSTRAWTQVGASALDTLATGRERCPPSLPVAACLPAPPPPRAAPPLSAGGQYPHACPALPGPAVPAGIRRLYELWPGIDEETLAESDPAEIGLAVKALSDAGPPRRLQ